MTGRKLFSAGLIFSAVLFGMIAVPAAADDDAEFEIVSKKSASSASAGDNSSDFEITRKSAQAGRQSRSAARRSAVRSSRRTTSRQARPRRPVRTTSRRSGKASAAEQTESPAKTIDTESLDESDFVIVRRDEIDQEDPAYQQKLRQYEERYRQYEERLKEYEAQKGKDWDFLCYHYDARDNKINGADARLFATLFIVSVIGVITMLVTLVRELGRRPPVYSVDQMSQLRAAGAAAVSSREAECFVSTLWNNATGGKGADGIVLSTRGEVHNLADETAQVACALPDDQESVDRLNALGDAVCLWQSRSVIAPGISLDSGIVKRIFMGIVYCVLVYLYAPHPMFLLVLFSPLAFMTPLYLVSSREGSLVYRMLGGSLKVFGKMVGNAVEGAGRMEGATATIYETRSGNVYIQENYWGVLIVFALKLAFAALFLYVVYLAAPLIVLYAVVRNYILAN